VVLPTIPEGTVKLITLATVVDVGRDTARSWPEKFCSLEIGMSRREVQEIMGLPTGSTASPTSNTDDYTAWGFTLYIFYDVDDLVQKMTSVGDPKVPCGDKGY
jgi:hypothetical protein